MQQRELIPWPGLNWDMNETSRKITQWISENLFESSRSLRKAQLYLWGGPHLGKTHLAQTLRASMTTYSPSHGEKYWDGFDDDVDLIIMDEFNGKSCQ